MTGPLFFALFVALGLPVWAGAGLANDPCDLSIFYRLRQERAPEYAHMSDMEYAVMTQQKVKQARKFGKIRAKLIGQTIRHFPEYGNLEADELIDVIEMETIQAIQCFETRD
jgi:hypothetical protein